jgi:hypothetical protein
MKIFIISMLVLFTLVACEKNNDENRAIVKKDLLGKWANLTEITDTLNFTDSLLYRAQGYYIYKYTIYNSDSLKLVYKGLPRIYIPSPYFLKMKLSSDKDTLEILNFHETFPWLINGDIFKKTQ